MGNKLCFLFGHATASYASLPNIEAAAERTILNWVFVLLLSEIAAILTKWLQPL